MATVKQLEQERERREADEGRRAKLHRALVVAETLDHTEKEVETLKGEFARRSDAITKLTGFELMKYDFGTDGVSYKWHWLNKETNEFTTSVDKYPSRAAAIRALVDNKIEWI
jgi:hypothetical protein